MKKPMLLNTHVATVILTFCMFLQFTSAQASNTDAAMRNIRKHLASPSIRTYNQPLLFVGIIDSFGPIYMGVCKEAVNEYVDFRIESVIWGRETRQGSQLRAGYINCTHKPLPAPPFTLHGRVIVYCQQVDSPKCLMPVEFSDQRLATVKSWLADLQLQ